LGSLESARDGLAKASDHRPVFAGQVGPSDRVLQAIEHSEDVGAGHAVAHPAVKLVRFHGRAVVLLILVGLQEGGKAGPSHLHALGNARTGFANLDVLVSRAHVDSVLDACDGSDEELAGHNFREPTPQFLCAHLDVCHRGLSLAFGLEAIALSASHSLS
jgi:hypothetical protein